MAALTHPFPRQRGTVTLVALCFVAALAIALSTYLALCSRTMTLSNRAFQRGTSEQLAEIGLEEALRAMNNLTTANPPVTWTSGSTTATWSVSGTTASCTIALPASQIGDLGVTRFAKIRIDNYNAKSVATAWNAGTSYAVDDIVSYKGTWYRCLLIHSNHPPPHSTYWASAPVVYAEGLASMIGYPTNRTQLRATLAYAPLFPNALASVGSNATYTIRFRNLGTVDSYDSSVGAYNSSTNRSAKAVISGQTLVLASSNTYGYVATNGTAPAPSYNVGLAKLYGAANASFPIWDDSRVSTSPYQPQFGVIAVTGSPPDLPVISSTTIGTPGVTRTYRVATNNWNTSLFTPVSGDLYLNAGKTLTIDGPVVLDIPGTLTTTGGGSIIITSYGSLEMHIGGDLVLGNGGIVNNNPNAANPDPSKVIFLGSDTGNDTPTVSTTIPLHAVFYMPNDTITFSSSPLTFYGSIVANRISIYPTTSTSTPVIHYDTTLRTKTISGVDAPYIISEWRELTDPAERIVLP